MKPVMSCVKNITNVIVVSIVVFYVAVVLTGCPPTKENNKNNASASLINIDSAALINHLATLSSAQMEGRETATHGNQLAREYIVKNFDSLQLEKTGDSYLQPFPFGNNNQQGTNIIGMIKGTKYPKNYIAITAHYDHLGIRNGNIYFGTDDNASGTAALLTMARYFKQHPPKHTLLFVAFDAEEKGLLGSKYFVAHCPVPLNTILLNVNMDMVSRNDKDEIYASGTNHYPFLKKYVDSVQGFTPVHILFGHDGEKAGSQDWTSQSDHFPFHQSHIPYIYFGVEDHADYHRPGDTFDKVNKSFYYHVCTMITAVTSLMDDPNVIE